VLYAVTAPDTGQSRLLRTNDGGATWAAALGGFPAATPATGPQHVTVATDPDVVWIDEPTSLHLTRDGGATWTTLAPPATATQLFVDRAQPQRVLVPSDAESAVYISRNWGAAWSMIALPEFAGCGGNWPFSCGLSMDASSVLYRGNAVLGTTGGVNSVEVWRSANWGDSWTQLLTVPSSSLDGVPSTLGSNVPGALFVPTAQGTFGSDDGGLHWALVTASNFWTLTAATAQALIGMNDAGLFATSDGGQSWQALPLVPNPTSLVASPAAPYPLWAGPGPVRSDDGGVTWRAVPSGSPGAVADGADPDVAYATNSTGFITMRTEDGGATWQPFASPTDHPVSWLGVCPAPRSCLFVLDPVPASAVMFRSDDHGRTWRPPTPWTNWDTRTQVVVSSEDPDHLLQGRSDAVYETHDGGQTWNYHQLGFPVVGLAFLSDTDVVGIGDQRQILRSNDGGINWTVGSSPFPAPPAGSAVPRLVQSSRRPNVLFVLTGDRDQPLFRSDDGGESWAGSPLLGELITDVVDLGQSFLAIVSNDGLVSFE
jgi:photosystem II stability/assembly factor-like uncharacterized protein